MRLGIRIALGALCVLILAGSGGYLWLRGSPYWAGITLFSEANRVENFRNMDRVFPYREVPAGSETRALPEDPRALPDSYVYDGSNRNTAEFLDATATTGLLVLHQGRIAHESYALGADASARFTSWSMAKSVLSALIGIALEEGHIRSLDDPLDLYLPALSGTAYGDVTLEQALTMSSGIAFDEDYDNPMSDVNRLFFSLAAGTPMIDALAALERARPAGSYNDYISSDSIALGLALEAATGVPNETYLATRLWGPMGAETDAYWSTGRAGPVLPFCCLNATLRDYARFGQLMRDGGAWNGVQIVPAPWVDISTRPSAPRLEPGENPASFWTFGYGYHWWVPDAPEEAFLAIGIWGQYIYVDRARDVVIVKTSADEAFDTRDYETVALFRAIAEMMHSSAGGS